MKIITGKVVGGRVDLPAEAAPDGTTVTVFVPEDEPAFELGPNEVDELQRSLDQASRGEVVDAWELLESLRR